MFTYAGEWRRAHDPAQAANDAPDLAPWRPEAAIGPAQLRAFLRYPVRAFFNMRLGVYFDVDDAGHDDLEPFVPDALQRYQLVEGLMRAGAGQSDEHLDQVLADEGERLRRSGRLPMAGLAEPVLVELTAAARSTLLRHARHAARFPHPVPKLEVQLDFGDLRIEDWLSGIHRDDTGAMGLVTPRHRPCDAIKTLPPIAWSAPGSSTCWRTRPGALSHPSWSVAMSRWHSTRCPKPRLPRCSRNLRNRCAKACSVRFPWQRRRLSPSCCRKAKKPGWTLRVGATTAKAISCAASSAGDPYLMRAYPDFDRLLAAGFRDHLKPYRALYRAFREEGDA